MKPSCCDVTGRAIAFLLALLAALAGPAAHAADDPVIRVETGRHQGFVNRLAVIDDGRIVTISDDQTARVWNARGEALGVVRGQAGLRDEGALYAVAVSPKYIALGGRAGSTEGAPFVRLVDRRTLAPAGLLANLPDIVTALAFSRDGQKLAVGFGRAGIRVYALGKGAPIAEIGAVGAVNDLLFLDDGGLMVSSDHVTRYDAAFRAKASIAIPDDFGPWRMALTRDGKLLAIGSRRSAQAAIVTMASGQVRLCGAAGQEGTAPAVAWSTSQLLVGGRDAKGGTLAVCSATGAPLRQAATGQAPVTAVAAAEGQMLFADAEGGWGSWQGAGAPRLLSQSYKLQFRRMSEAPLAVSPDGSQVTLSSGGAPFAALDLGARQVRRAGGEGDGTARMGTLPDVADLEPGERVLAAAPIAGGGQLVGTSFFLRRIDARGRSRWRAPAASAVWGVATAAQAKLAIAAQGDGTLAWHDLETGKLELNAYVSPDLDWVAWTPEGFFDRSGQGARLIGHSINRSQREGAVFVPLESTSQRYFRSDLVQAALRRKPADTRILASARGSIGTAGKKIAAAVPPTVTIKTVCGYDENAERAIACFDGAAAAQGLSARNLVSARMIDVTVVVDGQGSPPGDTRIRVGKVTVAPAGEKKLAVGGGEERRFRLELSPGDATVDIRVSNADGTAVSEAASFKVLGVRANAAAGAMPKLHILSIGISDYQLSQFDLGGGVATNDARNIAATFGGKANRAFDGGSATVLTDAQATGAGIRGALDRLVASAGPEDVVVVFFSGHGDQIDGDYAFGPYELGVASRDAALAKLRRGEAFSDQIAHDMFRRDGLSQADLGAFLARLRARKVIMVLDTCFGGAFDAMESVQRNNMVNALGERFAESSGRYVIASSRGLALDNAEAEAKTPNSIFTSAMLEGLGGAADRDKDGAVSLAELGDYIRAEVPKRAAKFDAEQRPVISFYGDPYFPLYKTR